MQETRKEIGQFCPECGSVLEEVTKTFENPFPEDNVDHELITHECRNCGYCKKIYCTNPDLVGVEKSP